MTVHNCPDCHCGPLGEAFAPRPSQSSEWARRQAKEAVAAAVRASKDARLAAAKEGKP